MANDVVIAGGGFGGLYTPLLPGAAAGHMYIMPAVARRLRLGTDWAVGLVFGRASAELGQLGHPPALGDYLDDVTRAGKTPGQ